MSWKYVASLNEYPLIPSLVLVLFLFCINVYTKSIFQEMFFCSCSCYFTQLKHYLMNLRQACLLPLCCILSSSFPSSLLPMWTYRVVLFQKLFLLWTHPRQAQSFLHSVTLIQSLLIPISNIFSKFHILQPTSLRLIVYIA